jgi:L-threonylcarbamoyladenylate synthase
METKLTRSPRVAAEFIRAGEVVAFPTETVYGLGADIFNESAIQKIFAAKGRPTDNPLIAHVAGYSELDLLAAYVPEAAGKLIDAFFPGPLTVVLPKTAAVPLIATAGLETVGVRMPRHALARGFLRACGTPLAAPSANLSGKPSPTTWQAVKADLEGRVSCILKGDQTEVGLESTVVDCTTDVPLVLRAGAVTLEALRAVVPSTALARAESTATPKSPGLKYRHYSPRAGVIIVLKAVDAVPAGGAAYIGLHEPARAADFKLRRVCGDVEDYARSLFSFFRACDEAGVEVIFCEAVAEAGLGLALMDRIKRAAHE